MSSLFSDYLTALGVRHTETYSDKRFAEMPFSTMYGLSALLREYGVGSTGVKIPEEGKAEALTRLPKPFLADTPRGFAIVTHVGGGNAVYQTQHRFFTASVEELAAAWNGIALIASSTKESAEPDYGKHCFGEIANSAKQWVLAVLAAAMLGFGMYASGLYAHPAAWALLVFDCMGIVFSWMLVLKSLGFRTHAMDAVCSVLQEGGCDVIARSEASSFMGIFKWSEVGMAYFSVSLLVMLCFPSTLPALALINILCLPYTAWSIWYQKFKAKAWCTLCVSVQCTLWLLFFAYLLGGYTKAISFDAEFTVEFIVLGCCYALVMLGLNKFDEIVLKHVKNDEEDGSDTAK
ncbi:MAG: hypothetical protein NC102_04140 [Clostridium sp.]|nr:hypothetical protein [Clostridium sp.]